MCYPPIKNPDMVSRYDAGLEAGPSEETRRKALAAKSYIENMYKMQHQNLSERRDR